MNGFSFLIEENRVKVYSCGEQGEPSVLFMVLPISIGLSWLEQEFSLQHRTSSWEEMKERIEHRGAHRIQVKLNHSELVQVAA